MSEEAVAKRWESVLRAVRRRGPTRVPGVRRLPLCPCVVFHDIGASAEHSAVDTPTAVFEEFLNTVEGLGYTLVSAERYFEGDNRHGNIICTFDDGYAGVFETAMPLMCAGGHTATVMMIAGQIGRDNSWNPKDNLTRRHLSETELLRLVEVGWEIGGHGLTHTNLRRLSESALDAEVAECREILTGLGVAPRSFAYPYNEWSPAIASIVGKHFDTAFCGANGGGSVVSDRLFLRRYSPGELLHLIASNELRHSTLECDRE